MDKTILEKMSKRQESNIRILAMLSGIVAAHPNLRFEQILYIYDMAGGDKDRFYEESVDTLERMEKISKSLIDNTPTQ